MKNLVEISATAEKKGLSAGLGLTPSAQGIPRGRVKLEGVEAGRGIAAMMVVLYHAALHVEGDVGGKILWGLPHFGHAGVDFFFVLSGFIITYVHKADIGRPERLPHYLQRRFTRVYPFYWVVLAILLIDLALLHRNQFPPVQEVISNLLLLPQAKDQIVGGAWTLVFEIMFYMAFAIAICSRVMGALLLAAWGLLITLGMAVGKPPFHGAFPVIASSAFCFEFMLGMGAAYFLSHRRLWKPEVVLIGALLGFGLAGILEVLGWMYGFGSLARFVYGGLSALIVAALVERERCSSKSIPRIMAVIGRSSYAVYLVHLLAIGVGFRLISQIIRLQPSYSLILWLILCIESILAGMAASRWIEQPMIRFARALLRSPVG